MHQADGQSPSGISAAPLSARTPNIRPASPADLATIIGVAVASGLFPPTRLSRFYTDGDSKVIFAKRLAPEARG